MSDEKSVIHEAIALASDVELLLTKNEFGFQRVLDDAQTSKTLYVVTWGILNRTDLLNRGARNWNTK